jgi:8-amino-7-oxononanoate synthase
LPDATPVPFPGAVGLEPSPPAPIVGLLTPTPHALSAFLLERGFIVRPVVPPTVPPGGERVRICLRAGVSDARVAELVAAIGEWAELQLKEKARL